MDKLLIVANLKSYKTENEAKEWLENFKKIKESEQSLGSKEIIVCPSFTLLSLFSLYFSTNNLPVKVGAQNVSPFDEGAYTGEINGKQIKEFADYVLIGHSERRQYFGENDLTFSKKVEMAKKYNLIPVYCITKKDTFIPNGVDIVAYEPVEAIGTGNPDTPENADNVASFIKSKYNIKYVLYGGSVTKDNVTSFTKKPNMDGVLVGKVSLEVKEFINIIKNA